MGNQHHLRARPTTLLIVHLSPCRSLNAPFDPSTALRTGTPRGGYSGQATIQDARCRISSELYRVPGLVETYDATKQPMVCRQKVTLGGR